MSRDTYPDEIEQMRSLESATEKQKRTAGILEEHWPNSLKTIGEQSDETSRSTLERVRDRYYGPKGYSITFGEVKELEVFDGRVKNWLKAERRGELDENGYPLPEEPTKEDIPKEIRDEIYQEGYDDGYDEGYEEGRIKGNQEGYMRLDNALLNNLDGETYREIRQVIDESSQK